MADYISLLFQKSSANEIVHEDCGQHKVMSHMSRVISDTLLVLHAMFRTLMGRYIEIPASCVSVYKLGRVFVLFPRLIPCLAKSTDIMV